MSNKALVIVDMQYDFVLPSGALYVPEAEKLVDPIREIAKDFGIVAVTQDWHQPNDRSFEKNGGTWPDHCVAGSFGAQLVDTCCNSGNAVFRKGQNSAFEDAFGSSTGLAEWLRAQWVDELHFVGVALNYCVGESAVHAAALGFRTTVHFDLTKPVNLFGTAIPNYLDALRAEGVAVEGYR